MLRLNLSNNLPPENYLRFYEIMHYPVPLNSELYFQYEHSRSTMEKHSGAIVRIVQMSGHKSLTWLQFVHIATAKDLREYLRKKLGRKKRTSAQYKPPRPRFVSGGLPSLGKR